MITCKRSFPPELFLTENKTSLEWHGNKKQLRSHKKNQSRLDMVGVDPNLLS